MKLFFLTGETVVKLLLATLVVLNILPWYLSAFWILICAGIFALMRKNKVSYKDNFSLNPDLMLSPISGKVLSVENIETEEGEEGFAVRASVPPYGPFGLYLPFDCVVESMNIQESQPLPHGRRGRPRFTKNQNPYNLTLRSKLGEKVEFEFLSGFLGLEPRFYTQPGDKGKTLACFGYFPAGGSLNIKLASQAKVMVAVGDKLKAGETAIAGF